MLIAVQAVLLVAYTLLAHFAATGSDQSLGAAALVVLALLMLAAPLLQRRAWALLALLPLAAATAWLYRHSLTLPPLLLVPPVFVAFAAWMFARTLLPGREALITRIVVGLEGVSADAMEPALYRYTRGVTVAWALLLGALALLNLLLALIAVPDGVLSQFGVVPAVTVTQMQWSVISSVATWVSVGGLMAGEYALRVRRFPGRYRSFADFVRRLSALGPAFWNDLLR